MCTSSTIFYEGETTKRRWKEKEIYIFASERCSLRALLGHQHVHCVNMLASLLLSWLSVLGCVELSLLSAIHISLGNAVDGHVAWEIYVEGWEDPGLVCL